MRPGVFISFEGIDGCGKTTQISLLASRLREAGLGEVVAAIEPGGTAAGRAIRALLLEARVQPLQSRTELLLFFASRAQNVGEVIAPALQRGAIVLCDRFTDSTIAYQGAGRGLDAAIIRELHRIACGDVFPSLTFLLDIDIETSLARARLRNRMGTAIETRMDDEDSAFFGRVRNAYEELAKQEPQRIRVIDARDSIEHVAGKIWEQAYPYVRTVLG